jgi:hypothetical protein
MQPVGGGAGPGEHGPQRSTQVVAGPFEHGDDVVVELGTAPVQGDPRHPGLLGDRRDRQAREPVAVEAITDTSTGVGIPLARMIKTIPAADQRGAA